MWSTKTGILPQFGVSYLTLREIGVSDCLQKEKGGIVREFGN